MPIRIVDILPQINRHCYQKWKWDTWEIELLNLQKQEKVRNAELAQRFGVPIHELKRTLRRHGLKRNRKWIELKDQIQAQLNKNKDTYELAAIFDTTQSWINFNIKRYNLIRPAAPPQKPRRARTNWKKEKPQLLQLRREGKTIDEIAEHYSKSKFSIYNAFKRMGLPLPKAKVGRPTIASKEQKTLANQPMV